MSINNLFSHPVAVASELFSAGWCNLDCKYCYISKVDRIKDIHKDIIYKIKSGKFLEELKYYFGDSLEGIGHWGTEPTLTIELFEDFYKKAIEMFPKLRVISFSSNFMTNPDKIVKFVRFIPKKLDLDLQISIDGPPEITDKNRRLGSTNKIIENIFYVLRKLNCDNTRQIFVHVKPTASREDIKYLSKFDNLKYYYDFFEDLFSKLFEFRNIRIGNRVDPTLVMPDNYTKDDGINFYVMYKNQIILRENYKYKFISPPDSYIYERAVDKLFSKDRFYNQHRMFLCSAGDSCFALGNRPFSLHYCHRAFYTDDDDYVRQIDDVDHQSIERILGTFAVIKNKASKLDIIKFLMRPRCFNDFARLTENFFYSICVSLVDTGVINDIYKNWEMSKILNFYYLLIACFLESAAKSGSMFIPDSNIITVLGNGFGELCTKRLIQGGYL